MKRKNGFSLLELILVLGIASSVSFMKFQDLKQDQESIQARAVGEQIKQIGEAVNGYINIRYDKLSTLSAATGTGTDPGPRTCSGSVCTITYQTLINEGLLPASFTGVNVNKSAYTIILKRGGTAPNYIINGLITTNNAWVEGSKIRYDLLGKAMQTAGIDSGMTKTASAVSGFSGSWSADAKDYSNVNKTGILGYRVGYDSAMYSVYLRRDGTLPMTGNLNMGGNDINNAKNITASGTGSFRGNVTSGGNINAAHEVIAHNGYGDSITLGGDAAGEDYEIRLSSGVRPLSIYSPNAKAYTTTFNVFRNATIKERLGLMGYNPNDLPSGWGGGLRTLDVYASGTVGAGSDGNVHAYINSAGNIYASGNITGTTIKSNGTIESAGRTTVGEYIDLKGIAALNTLCSPNGLVGRDSSGKILSCVNGSWTNILQVDVFTSEDVGAYGSGYGDKNIGLHTYCALSQTGFDYNNFRACMVSRNNDGTWTLTAKKGGNGQADCVPTCF